MDELKKSGYGGGAPGKIFDVFRGKKNGLSAQNFHQCANGSYGGSASTAEISCCGRISEKFLAIEAKKLTMPHTSLRPGYILDNISNVGLLATLF